jgi:hypothetical protein
VEADGADVSSAYSAVVRCDLLVESSAKSFAGIVVLGSGAFAYRVRRIGWVRCSKGA